MVVNYILIFVYRHMYLLFGESLFESICDGDVIRAGHFSILLLEPLSGPFKNMVSETYALLYRVVLMPSGFTGEGEEGRELSARPRSCPPGADVKAFPGAQEDC